MKLAVDVHYFRPEDEDRARSAGLLFDDWTDEEPVATEVREIVGVQPYVPGAFYRRELPCLLPMITDLVARYALTTIIVDGYVDLGPGRPGLGRHLFDALDGGQEVVGVAKNVFHEAPAVEITRGDSHSPLFVTSTADAEEAARAIRQMHGAYRMPTMLRQVDQLARGLLDS